jgi:hypothetical protein
LTLETLPNVFQPLANKRDGMSNKQEKRTALDLCIVVRDY